MPRTRRFLPITAFALGIVAVAAAPAAQQPTFRGGSDAVRVFVTVTLDWTVDGGDAVNQQANT